MPAMIVWPVSSVEDTWKVGSSSASFWIAAELLLVALGLGLDGDLDDRLGKVIDSRTTWLLGRHRVSPVVVSLRPMAA